MKRLLIFLAFAFPHLLLAQNPIDSLYTAIRNTTSTNEKSKLYQSLLQQANANDLQKALKYGVEFVEFAEKTNEHKIKMAAHHYLANTYFFKGIYDMSLKEYLKACEFSSKLKNDTLYLVNVSGAAACHFKMENYKHALKYYQKSYGILKPFPHTKDWDANRASLLMNIGVCNRRLEHFSEAERLYTEALEFAKGKENLYVEANIYSNLGELNVLMKNDKVGLAYYRKALGLRIKDKYSYSIARSYLHFSKYFNDNQFADSALHYGLKCYEIGKKLSSTSLVYDASVELARAYEQIRQSEKAIEFLKESLSLKDSIMDKKRVQEVAALTLKHEIERVKQEKEAEQQEKEFLYLIITVVSVLSVIILILAAINMRNRMVQAKLEKQNLSLEKHRLQHELEYKNKELTTNVMYLLKKNELIISITDTLKQLTENLKEENIQAVNSIIRKLKQNVNDDTWESFERHFLDVHTGFYKKLDELYDLTPNERKMCAFLRLNLSTKEISAITGQSTRSIEVTRYRIRKKMNITNTDANLVSHIMKF